YSGTLAATDVDGDSLTYTVLSGPSHGTLTSFNASTGAYTYAPALNYNGPDGFTFKASDGSLDSNTAAVSITVTAVNDAPVVSAIAGPGSGVRGQTLSFSGSFSDPDTDTWTATVNYGDGTATQPLTLNTDKTFAFSHAYAASGTYTVTVTVTDNHGT